MIDFGFDLAGRRAPRLRRGAIVSALGALMEAAPYAIAYVVLDGVFSGTATWGWLPWVVGALVALMIGTALLKTVGGIDSFIATYSLVCDARLNLVDHLRRLPMGFWTAQRTGSVGSVVTDEFALYTEVVTHVWSLVITHATKPLALATVVLIADWQLGLVAIALLPLALLSVPWSHRLLNRAADRLAATKAHAHGQLVEIAQGIGTLREYGRVGLFHERLEATLEAFERDQMRIELAPAPAIFTYKLVVWLGFSLTVAVGAWMVAQGSLAPTRFLLVALLALPLFEAASELSNYLALARFASRTLTRIRALFDQPTQPDPEASTAPADATIRFEDVRFSYADRPTIRGVSATLAPGTVTALVGPSGSGKSTLAHLLLRLWDIDEGRISIGGVDLRALPLAVLRRHVGAVLQDVVLFGETVEENIRLGRPDATRAEVIAAAQAAQAHDFIEALPAGYDTVLAEGGGDLSCGQRQRLSIARTLLLDAPILVLDEATSSVDSQNELRVQQAIGAVSAGRTLVVIAHRLWTIQHADQILVLDEGRVVERGTHPELLARGGLYHRLWTTQQQSRGWRLGDDLDQDEGADDDR